jgi:hypothetical protein
VSVVSQLADANIYRRERRCAYWITIICKGTFTLLMPSNFPAHWPSAFRFHSARWWSLLSKGAAVVHDTTIDVIYSLYSTPPPPLPLLLANTSIFQSDKVHNRYWSTYSTTP